MPEQVQDFYPTPGTLSTCMFYTGYVARNMKKVYVPKTPREKAMQRALLQYRKKENYHLVIEALKEAHREDLIGFGPNCLVKPLRGRQYNNTPNKGKTAGDGSKAKNSRRENKSNTVKSGKIKNQTHRENSNKNRKQSSKTAYTNAKSKSGDMKNLTRKKR